MLVIAQACNLFFGKDGWILSSRRTNDGVSCQQAGRLFRIKNLYFQCCSSFLKLTFNTVCIRQKEHLEFKMLCCSSKTLVQTPTEPVCLSPAKAEKKESQTYYIYFQYKNDNVAKKFLSFTNVCVRRCRKEASPKPSPRVSIIQNQVQNQEDEVCPRIATTVLYLYIALEKAKNIPGKHYTVCFLLGHTLLYPFENTSHRLFL